ncbi:hypothetical protein [Alkalibacillus aidingensis]|uniref:hypothetical protein n=1 Tax=Alkalibacillus aidingensis TaxID=2747607 RepID=UPI0016604247|nr:hypothetical protein [Alkalibacillus aidingensis]
MCKCYKHDSFRVLLLVGLTLVLALFTAFGRRAFWPAQPKVGEDSLEKSHFWAKMSKVATTKPILLGLLLISP